MDSYVTFICEYAPTAPWIIFGLLLLAGFCLPISEDLLLLTGGALASSCAPEHIPALFIWTFFGCWLSAWEAYWIGRLLGPKLYQIRLFGRLLPPHRVERLHEYYERFGVFTFIVGRFIPGGARNALFMTSGLGKMPFLKFIIRDGFACLISSTTLFYLGYKLGENFKEVLLLFERYRYMVLAGIAFVLCCAVLIYKKTRNGSKGS